MKRTIYFATSNKNKLIEARKILGINIQGLEFEIDEIQSLDQKIVATKKAIAYFEKVKKPLFVEDISLTFNALKTLPGTYINDFLDSLGNDGLIRLLSSYKDRSAIAQATIVYIYKNLKPHCFIGRVKGTISIKPKGKTNFGWDPIFIPDGENRTFAQMSLEEKNKYSMRAMALKKLKKWLDKQILQI